MGEFVSVSAMDLLTKYPVSQIRIVAEDQTNGLLTCQRESTRQYLRCAVEVFALLIKRFSPTSPPCIWAPTNSGA